MILTPNSFTYEYLSGLKFKELQKLSVQFHVNKRWAKKQELIENLLALKKKEETSSDNDQGDGKEWRDGSTVFNDVQQNTEKEFDRRLTFNVSTKPTDSHLTFEISQNGKNLLGETLNSRETYDTSPNILDFGGEPLKDSRATFEIPAKGKLLPEVDPRATFDIPQNGKKLLDESEAVNSVLLDDDNAKGNTEFINKEVGLKQNLGNTKVDIKIKNREEDKGKRKLQVKTLTIPYARVTRRTRKDGETCGTDDSPIKMSKKSINIKKSTRLPVSRNNLVKSPVLSSVKKQTVIQTITKPQPAKVTQSKVPVRLNFSEVKLGMKPDEGNKENMMKRIMNTADEMLLKKSNVMKVNFRTPPPTAAKTSRAMPLKKTPLRKDANARLNKSAVATPSVKSTTKSITATKMPDFSKIHKRQFEQMDSLHDYLKKKEERVRKLFGTPQPGQQVQVLNKTAPVFRFQSVTEEKEMGKGKGREDLNKMATPVKKTEMVREDAKTAHKEAFKSKLPPLKLRSEIKDKNRSHIHGVRTNKRFELQMKFRNM